MPILFTKSIAASGVVGVWKIEEPEIFFHNNLNLTPTELEQLNLIQQLRRKKEWLASRYLLHLLSGQTPRIACLKDIYGKPYLENFPFQISISHSHELAAAIAAPYLVGIDVQLLVPKLEGIKHKFLRKIEMESLHPIHTLSHLHVYWGAKEALYKAYGKKELDFKTNILVEPFTYLADTGVTSGSVQKGDIALAFQIYYQIIHQAMLVYVLHQQDTALQPRFEL